MRSLPSFQVLLVGTLATVRYSEAQSRDVYGQNQYQPQAYNPNQYRPGSGNGQNQYQPQSYSPNQYPPGNGQNQYQPQAYNPNQYQPQGSRPNQYQPQGSRPNQYQPQDSRPNQNQQPWSILDLFGLRQGQPRNQPQNQPQADTVTTGYDSAPNAGAYSPPVSGPRIGGPIWRPKIGQKIQVILDRRLVDLDPNAPLYPQQADIWDLDLFETTKQVIDVLHAKGKRVICYLSIGGTESWRPDANSLPKSDLGDTMPKWKGERYLNIKSPAVWKFMQNRIRMAYEKGCDALDPDNVDPFNDDFERGGGFNLTEADSVEYLRKISVEAAKYGMSMGMKNAESLIPSVSDFIDFAVNEECSTYSTDEDGCWQYEEFLKKGKPVFHFEYVNVDDSRGYPEIQSVYKDWANLTSPQILAYYCLQNNFGFPYLPTPQVGSLFSTAIKKLDLGGWIMYCDATYAETPTAQSLGDPDRVPGGQTRDWGQRSGKGGKKGSGGPELVNPNQGPLKV